MPFYRFIIHGRGSFISDTIGFYTTRWCWAPNYEAAGTKALDLVRRDWESGDSARLNRGGAPSLEIDKGWRISLFEIWSGPNRGNTLYGADEPGPMTYWVVEPEYRNRDE